MQISQRNTCVRVFVIKTRLQHRRFPVNIAKISSTSFSQTAYRLLLSDVLFVPLLLTLSIWRTTLSKIDYVFLFSKKNKDLSAKDVKIGRFIQMSFEKHGFSLTNAFSHLYGSQSVKVIGSQSQVFYGIAVFKKVRPFNLSGSARSLSVLIDFSRSPGLSSFFFSIAYLLPQTILFAFQTVFFWHIKFFFGKC